MYSNQNRVCQHGSGYAMPRLASGIKRTECPFCGRIVRVTARGNLRKHDQTTLAMMGKFQVKLPEPEPEVYSLRDLSHQARRIKDELQDRFIQSQDPRYNRMWQHAMTLEKWLRQVADEQSLANIDMALFKARETAVAL